MLRARARATLFKIFLKGKESHFSFVFHAFCGWRGLDGNFFFAFFLESASAFSSLSRSNLCNVHRFENHGDGRFWERGRTRRRPNRNVAELPAVCQEISGNSTDSDQTACHLVSTIPNTTCISPPVLPNGQRFFNHSARTRKNSAGIEEIKSHRSFTGLGRWTSCQGPSTSTADCNTPSSQEISQPLPTWDIFGDAGKS